MHTQPRAVAVLIALVIAVTCMVPAVTESASATRGVTRRQPTRVWNIDAILADGTRRTLDESPDPPLVGGALDVSVDAGATDFDDDLNDGRATPHLFATPNGVTYGSFAQSPIGAVRDPQSPLGNVSRLVQFQRFRKDDANATLSFKVTSARITVHDNNGTLDPRFPECAVTNPLFGTCDGTMQGSLTFSVRAYRGEQTYYQAAGGASLRGWQGNFIPHEFNYSFSTSPLWFPFNFDYTVEDEGAELSLFDTRSHAVDISDVPVGSTFTVRSDATTTSYDRRIHNNDGDSSGVHAFIQDPQETGTRQFSATGLTRLANPQLETPPDEEPEPAACPTGTDPEAGTLQFDAAASTVGEWAEPGESVFVTRTGGTVGPVSAVVTSSDGTASAISDYEPVSTVIRFEDGDATPRAVPISIVEDLVAEDDKTVNLTLSDPACTTLADPASTVLTIADDDKPLETPSFTVGGTVTGLEGGGLELSHLGEQLPIATDGPFAFSQALPDSFPYDVEITSQPTDPDQICSISNNEGTITGADVTDIAVDSATTAPNTELDPTFGGDGSVMSPGVHGARAVAMQPDGDIVVAGDHMLARYEPDGDLDPTFGDQGVVATGLDASFFDDASDVAIQTDGSIVVVGVADGIGEDFGVERYDGSGAPDESFGTHGRVTTDFNGGTDHAYAVAVDANDNIVVAGHATDAAGTGNDFAVARYTSSGAPDTSFNGTGRLTTDILGEGDLAHSIALQPDGRIIVGGRISDSPTAEHFGVVRYESDGQLDDSFGDHGIAVGAIAGSADGLVLQPDGKILVAVGEVGDFAVARLDEFGAPDPSFGILGIVTTDFGNFSGPFPASEYAHELALQPDGEIVVVGVSEGDRDWAIARYDETGHLDGTFADAGILTVDFAGGFDSAFDVAIQDDGRIVVVGSAPNGFTDQAGLVRIDP